MNWFYVDQGQQAGPVDDTQLDQLRATGKIQPDTLIWREGMANWTPYGEARGSAAPASPASPGLRIAGATGTGSGGSAGSAQATCTQCGGVFPVENMIRYGASHICANCKPVFMQKLAEGARIHTGEMRYAGFWIRFVAKFIDGLVLGVPFMAIFMILLGAQLRGGAGVEPDLGLLPVLIQLVFVGIQFAYQVFFIGRYGATLGKMACKLKVVKEDGGRVTYGRATGRFFGEMLSGLICNIGYIMAAFDGQKRTLHDHICNTRVIYK
jgi:uncharacterized RDD family membrane protein YckC